MVKKALLKAHLLPLLAAVLILSGMQSLNAQDPKIRRATAISTIEQLFALAVPGSQTGVHIFMNGMVEEWDSVSQYSMHYPLRKIDLQQAEIIRFDEADEIALLLQCSRNENCVKLTDASKKQRFYSSVHAFTMPGDKERVLAEIEALLREIQATLPR